jgi:hypothetical protein
MKNPVGQVDRHETVIKYYLSEKFPNINIPVTGIIALANENIAFEGQENCPIPVKKSEQLTYFIKSKNSDVKLKREDIDEIYKDLSQLSDNISAIAN